jgi:hypothetical protein
MRKIGKLLLDHVEKQALLMNKNELNIKNHSLGSRQTDRLLPKEWL